MSIDPEELTGSLRRLVADADHARGDLRVTLQDVVEACVALFGVTGSGVMLADEQDALHYVASTHGQGRLLEKVEASSGEGPCTDAFFDNRPVWTSDLREDERWPRLREALRDQQELRAVLGVPVTLGGIPVGTLDVFRDGPHEWTDEERAALTHYADVVQVTISAALSAHTAGEQAAQLQYALDYRVVIERGVGYLMARDGVDAGAAFNTLRSAARNSRTKVGQVAQHLLDTGRLPGA